MAATINNFVSAFTAPALNFTSLGAITPQRDERGAVKVSRTTHFAEVCAKSPSSSFLLSLPLTPQASAMAQRVAVALRQLRSPLLLDYRLLKGELSYIDSRGALSKCDLLFAELPAGAVPLSQRIREIEPHNLFTAIEQMQTEFLRLKLVHSNLKLENIVVDETLRLYPIRLHYACVGGDCTCEFDALRREVCEILGVEEPIAAISTSSKNEAPTPKNALYGYLSVGNPFEGMCVAESDEGYGYLGVSGQEVIPPKYLWANDMREGRAEVETSTGMGLIDAAGNYIIEPIYQIVEFNPHTTLSRAKCHNGEWLTFDYEGRVVS